MLIWLLMIVTVESADVIDQASARAYQPRGSALELFYARDDEVLLDGPAGTGKTRANLEKIHLLALKYAGMRGLIVRKTRVSLTDSGLVTFEEKVLPAGSYLKSGPKRRYRQSYKYHNGSEIVIGGMDHPTRVMSTDYDIALAIEATEFEEEDFDNITTRLRNGAMPYQQLIADCNPGQPGHWLNLRCNPTGEAFDKGRHRCRRLLSRHEDNPQLWDAKRREWTQRGAAYIAKLDRLPGARKMRLRHGVWSMAEGMVYEGWDPARHLVYRIDEKGKSIIRREWERFWVVDFGHTHPFVWQCWAKDDDGRLYRIAEIYQTKRLVEDHARKILEWMKREEEPTPIVILCDHDAEGRATLERYLGMGTVPAYKAVQDGIDHVGARLRLAGDGRARVLFLRDSLIEVDEELREAKKPSCTEEEFEGYVWAKNALGLKEVPVDKDNHGMDCVRYLVCYIDKQYSEGVFV